MNASALTNSRTFRSLRRHRNYRLWFGGQVISMTGTWVQIVAQSWFIAALTHSAVALGVLTVCQFGPYALFGVFGGVVSDRFDNRQTLIWTQVAFMVSAAMMSVITLTGIATVWEVDAIAVFYGAVRIIDTPARQAFTVEMVGRDELPNAVALNSSLFNASRVVGPAIGGLITAALGVGICFVIDGVSFLAVIRALAIMDPTELRHPERRGVRRSVMRETGEGLAYVWRTPTIRIVTLMMLLIGTVAMNFNVILPILAQSTLGGGAALFGWLTTAFGAGALIGALISATLTRPTRRLILLSALFFGMWQLLMAGTTAVPAYLALLVLDGIAFSLYTSMSNATIQLIVPDHLRGRTMAVYAYVFFGTAPVGGLLTGWLLSVGGTRLAFAVAGATALVVSFAATAEHLVVQRRGNTRETAPVPETLMARQ